ncbi:MAG: VOC family protein [Silicimonas sp.]|nr:VOC family protein [Silicimonas sp.]
MAQARLEHANITVTDPKATATWMTQVFGWTIRWEGPGMETGYTVHVGEKDSYLALFSFGDLPEAKTSSYRTIAGLNHLAVVVDDLDATEARVKAEGFKPRSHADYEPGRRFYFEDADGIEFEVVCYA